MSHEILRKFGIPLVAIMALGNVGCTAANAERPPTVATATQSGDTAPTTSPSASETKTASPEKWLPSRGDFLAPDKMATMSDSELREACTISADDPDAQTPDGLIKLWEYISTSALNATTTPGQLDPYRNGDGQIPFASQDKFMNEATKKYMPCIEGLMNDGVKRSPSNFEKYLADVYAMQVNVEPDGPHQPYRVESRLFGAVHVADDGTYSYTIDELDNREDTLVPQLGSDWAPRWGGHHKVTVHVSTKDGKYVFTNRAYETTAS